MLELMQLSSEPAELIDVAPLYNIARLELALRDAADGFKDPWRGRLGLNYHEGIRKEHWGRVKALCRRIANRWDDEYNGLRPVADLVRQLQTSISLWLDSPTGLDQAPGERGRKPGCHRRNTAECVQQHPCTGRAASNHRALARLANRLWLQRHRVQSRKGEGDEPDL